MKSNDTPRRIMSVAVASGKVGMVILDDGELMDWELSILASKTEEQARKKIAKWLEFYSPDLLITEEPQEYSRKSEYTNSIIRAIAANALEAGQRHHSVNRTNRFANKYQEAKYFADKFPQIAPWLPEPRQSWEPEKRHTVLFEAISLASGTAELN